jgi:hypothetical protein
MKLEEVVKQLREDSVFYNHLKEQWEHTDINEIPNHLLLDCCSELSEALFKTTKNFANLIETISSVVNCEILTRKEINSKLVNPPFEKEFFNQKD